VRSWYSPADQGRDRSGDSVMEKTLQPLPKSGWLNIDFLTFAAMIGALIAYYYDLLTQEQFIIAIAFLALWSVIEWLARKRKG
jgi:hypothetical protein